MALVDGVHGIEVNHQGVCCVWFEKYRMIQYNFKNGRRYHFFVDCFSIISFIKRKQSDTEITRQFLFKI